MNERGSRINPAEVHIPLAHPGQEIPVIGASSIGPHPVGEVLGIGGSATVMRVGDGETALKIYNRGAYRPDGFQTEVSTLQTLHKLGVPNVLPLVDHGVAHIDNELVGQKVPYIEIPVAEGGSLKDVLSERTLSPKEIVDVVAQAAETLSAMHEKDIVDGDLKPDSILFPEPLSSDTGEAPSIWIADLESAGPSTDYDTTAIQRTSVAYAAPEQFGGKNVPQTDIYELGEVVFEAITGERLWEKGTRDERIKVLQEKRHDPYIEERLTIIDGEYAAFKPALRRALKRNLRERYLRVTSFAEDIMLGYQETQDTKAQDVTVYNSQELITS